MITFYPGPSKVYSSVEGYLNDAFRSGILSANHRSPQAMTLVEKTIDLLKEKLRIPPQYSVYFVSSATEAWEIVGQSLVGKGSVHIYNGAFGQKWAEYTQKLVPSTSRFKFGIDEAFDFEQLSDSEADVVCITQNETSNGTQIKTLSQLKTDALVVVDVTSSLGGIHLDFTEGDVWFASVQKCLGLPAGMGLMICSPKALERAKQLNDQRFYNSFLFIHENFQKFQTHYTPNVLGIYLLCRVMEQVPDIQSIDQKIKTRARDFYEFLEKCNLKPLVQNQTQRSDTVIAVKIPEEQLGNLKQKANSQGITLGNGYGFWKNNTFRIANFPAIDDWEFDELKDFLVNLYQDYSDFQNLQD
jgi:phosphoserine aminotransferase